MSSPCQSNLPSHCRMVCDKVPTGCHKVDRCPGVFEDDSSDSDSDMSLSWRRRRLSPGIRRRWSPRRYMGGRRWSPRRYMCGRRMGSPMGMGGRHGWGSPMGMGGRRMSSPMERRNRMSSGTMSPFKLTY